MKTFNWKNLVLGAFLLGGAAVQTGCSVGVSGIVVSADIAPDVIPRLMIDVTAAAHAD
jgi:hypothetical protein